MLFCLLNNQSKLIITQNQMLEIGPLHVKTVPVLNLSVEPSSLVVTLNMRKVAIHNKNEALARMPCADTTRYLRINRSYSYKGLFLAQL